MTKRKRLYFDIEVSPNIGFFWNPGHKVSISYENIIHERAIICICYKWEYEKRVSFLTWDKNQCDKAMLREFVKIANTSDELIGHNGDRFDLTWIRTRCLFHDIQMFPNYTTIDTLKVSRSKFRFNSNRLDYIGKFLGIGKKIHTGFDLWKDIVLNKSDSAMAEMVKYCKQDVLLLQSIHEKLDPYIPAKVHYGVLGGDEKTSCPSCGSSNTINSKMIVKASGNIGRQRLCKDCGKYHTINIRRGKST